MCVSLSLFKFLSLSVGVYLSLSTVCLFLDEGVSLSVCVPVVCLSLCISVCVSQYVCLSVFFSLSLSA